jgi:hypothetical protein
MQTGDEDRLTFELENMLVTESCDVVQYAKFHQGMSFLCCIFMNARDATIDVSSSGPSYAYSL